MIREWIGRLDGGFRKWKPIHLCWFFKKLGLPIPRYLIGAAAVLDQRNYIFADDDNADPDNCTFDAENTPREAQALDTNVMVRLQVAEDGGDATLSKNWQLFYNTVDNENTATQVTTLTNPAIVNGTPADAAVVDVEKCSAQPETWQNGLYSESDETGKLLLAANGNTEFQFCIQFTTGATGDYYFYLFHDDSKLSGTYDNVAKITIGVSTLSINVSECEEVIDKVL